jgi:hypothetical protein
MHCYIVRVYNLYTKTLKMLLHVSILRSSSGNIHCSLLKLYVKMLITLLYVSVMRQHIICMCKCYITCREVGLLAYFSTGDTTFTLSSTDRQWFCIWESVKTFIVVCEAIGQFTNCCKCIKAFVQILGEWPAQFFSGHLPRIITRCTVNKM